MLTNSKEYELASANSTSISYKILKRMGGVRGCKYIHPLPLKYMQLVTYIENNDLMKSYNTMSRILQTLPKSHVGRPSHYYETVIIFLFIKNLYNKEIRRVANAKVIDTLTDIFKLAHYGLLKLKKYESLVYNEG